MIRAVIVSLYGRVWERGGFWPGGLITSVDPVHLSSARSGTISVSTLETDRAPAALEKMKAPRGAEADVVPLLSNCFLFG